MPLSRIAAIAVLSLAALAACEAPLPPETRPALEPAAAGPAVSPTVAARNFTAVVARMEPLIEEECRARTRNVACDFRIVVDERVDQGPNAYQTLDRAGRPIIAFTLPLIADSRNQDELAFILGHEAAHHIEQHIPKQSETALTGALIFGVIAAASGADPSAVQTAQDVGATVAARRFAKEYELEADALGTVIAFRAGYDPERGAAYFARIPDPGNRFLGTHPPNAARIATVRRVLADLR